MGIYDRALTNQLNSLEIFKKGSNKNDIASAMKRIGHTYIQKKDFQMAEKYLQESLAVVQNIKAKPLLLEVCEYLVLLYEEKGDIKSALRFQKLYTATKDGILNEDSMRQINLLQTKFETSEKEKEIALLTKEKEVQEKEARRKATLMNAIIGGLMLALLLAGLLFYTFRQRVRNQKLVSKKNAEITEVNFKQQLSELEMKALRAQMNPHFVFNCLNSINRMILSGDIKDASGYLTKFSRLIRKVLENSEKNMVSIADELTMLKAYIQLESLRFKGKIRYKTELDKNIDVDATFIPSMVLQPLVENAIWHGLMHKEKGGTILLSIEQEDEILKCSIEDDGVGRQPNNKAHEGEEFMKERSMGLNLTTERLKIMGQLGLKRFIEIIDLKDEDNNAVGTRVDLLIPIG
jgi:LytS/YehU family sensor histidine kinase